MNMIACLFVLLIICFVIAYIYRTIIHEKFSNDVLKNVSAVMIYPECNFQGDPVFIPKGQLAQSDLEQYGFTNKIGSLKFMNATVIDLFDHDYFQGNRLRLLNDEECLSYRGFGDVVSSIIVS